MGSPVMLERKEPKFIQFGVGEIVNGVLVSIEKINIRDQTTDQQKPAVRYTVREDDGEFCCFLGAAQLNQKLRSSDRGHYVSIRCEGENKDVSRNGNSMKVFRVLVSADPIKDAALYITDDDIPF